MKMYDETTNSDLIWTLTETACNPPPFPWELMLEAARRIEKLEAQAKKWELLAKEWESAANAASGCDTPENLRHFLNNCD